jgi:hypothetical protein
MLAGRKVLPRRVPALRKRPRQRKERGRAIVALPVAKRGQVRTIGDVPATLANVTKKGSAILEAYTHPDLLPSVKILEGSPPKPRRALKAPKEPKAR